jgi:hypothetical protein
MYTATKTALAENLGLIVGGIAAFAALWNLLPPVGDVSLGVLAWWTTLCAVSVFNICSWRVSAAALARRRSAAHPEVYIFQRRQLVLSAVYVLGCAFRSVVPRADVQRIGLFDSFASSVMVGRSVATVAELCFVAQWAFLLHRIAKDAQCRPAVVISWLLVPVIAAAEVCSWYSVITTSYLGNAIEESLWALTAFLLLVACLSLWARGISGNRVLVGTAIALCALYVAFMCTVDIPMYVSRWLADEASGRQYLSLSQGLADVSSRWVVTLDWEAWRSEIPWMSLYFTLGVWCSIALVHAPRLEMVQPTPEQE